MKKQVTKRINKQWSKTLIAATTALFCGSAGIVILLSPALTFAQTKPKVPIAVSGDADTGPDSVSVVFYSGELQEWSKDTRYLSLSFKVKATIGSNYTNGATRYFDTKDLMLHPPKGDDIAPQDRVYPQDCPGRSCSLTLEYVILRGDFTPGAYSIINNYVGCCGTRHGQVTFAVPPWPSTVASRPASEVPTSLPTQWIPGVIPAAAGAVAAAAAAALLTRRRKKKEKRRSHVIITRPDDLSIQICGKEVTFVAHTEPLGRETEIQWEVPLDQQQTKSSGVGGQFSTSWMETGVKQVVARLDGAADDVILYVYKTTNGAATLDAILDCEPPPPRKRSFRLPVFPKTHGPVRICGGMTYGRRTERQARECSSLERISRQRYCKQA